MVLLPVQQQMNILDIVVPAVLFILAITAVIFANYFVVIMISQLNAKRPPDRQIGYFGFTPWKSASILGEYRADFPNGKALTGAVACICLAVILLLAAFFSYGLL